MFLRGPLVSRFTPALLRLCGNSAHSTSNSSLYFSPASLCVSRCNSQAIATSTPQLAKHFGASLVWIRPGGRKTGEKSEDVKGARSEKAGGSNSSSRNNGGDDTDWLPSKKACFVLSIFAALFSAYMAVYVIVDIENKLSPCNFSSAPRVDFATFTKYLRTGEIKKIRCIEGNGANKKVVAELHDGAIVDGKPTKSRQILVIYPHSSEQFCEDVRNVEAEMGIPRLHGVQIERSDPASIARVLFVYCFIFGIVLWWLLTCSNVSRRMLATLYKTFDSALGLRR